MKDLSKEERSAFAQEMGWTLKLAQGYVDGEFYQRFGQDMPECHKVSMDEYSKGFRAGYHSRDD